MFPLSGQIVFAISETGIKSKISDLEQKEKQKICVMEKTARSCASLDYLQLVTSRGYNFNYGINLTEDTTPFQLGDSFREIRNQSSLS